MAGSASDRLAECVLRWLRRVHAAADEANYKRAKRAAKRGGARAFVDVRHEALEVDFRGALSRAYRCADTDGLVEAAGVDWEACVGDPGDREAVTREIRVAVRQWAGSGRWAAASMSCERATKQAPIEAIRAGAKVAFQQPHAFLQSADVREVERFEAAVRGVVADAVVGACVVMRAKGGLEGIRMGPARGVDDDAASDSTAGSPESRDGGSGDESDDGGAAAAEADDGETSDDEAASDAATSTDLSSVTDVASVTDISETASDVARGYDLKERPRSRTR